MTPSVKQRDGKISIRHSVPSSSSGEMNDCQPAGSAGGSSVLHREQALQPRHSHMGRGAWDALHRPIAHPGTAGKP